MTVLHALAADPRTPQVILDQLTDLATTGGRDHVDLRAHLAANPAVPPTTVTHLADGLTLTGGRDTLLTAALTRPNLSVDDAVTILAGDDTTNAYLTALGHIDDPTGRLVTYVADHATTSQALHAVLTHPAATLDQRRRAATTLATWPTLSTRHAATIARFAQRQLTWATTPDQARTATSWVAHLRTTTTATLTDLTRTSRLGHGQTHVLMSTAGLTWPGPPAPGTRAWITNPATPTSDVITWANQRPDTRWPKVLRARHDPDHTLAHAAPVTRYGTARALVDHKHAPITVRQAAAITLADADALDDLDISPALLAHGDPALAARLATCTHTPRVALPHIRRDDWGPGHVDVVADHLTAHDPDVVDLTWVATHPHVSPTRRARALTALRRLHTPPHAWIVPAACALADAGVTTADAAHAAAQHIPADTTLTPAWVARAVVTAVTARPWDPDHATVLLHLAQGFTGTVADLLTTVEAITT